MLNDRSKSFQGCEGLACPDHDVGPLCFGGGMSVTLLESEEEETLSL